MMSLKHLILIGFFLQFCSYASSAHELLLKSPSQRTPSYINDGAQPCLRCHSGPKMHAIASSAHGNPGNAASPLASRGCESCHGPGSIHVSRAHGGRGFPPLITFGRGSSYAPRDVQIHTCLVCHIEEISGRNRIEFFGSPHDRSNINCSTCHEAHVETDPMNDRQQQDKLCYRCHRKQRTEHPKFEDKSIDFESLSCGTCHDVHKVIAEKVSDMNENETTEEALGEEPNKS